MEKLTKLKYARLVSSFIIFTMLSIILIYTSNVNATYTFTYSNPDIIYNGNRNSNKVCLMINVYWGNEFIPKMLDILNNYNVKTTFFIGGTWAEKNPDLLELIYENGHEIGNHAYFHLDQDKLDYNGNIEEINTCHKMVKSIINYDMQLFAPPSGAFNSSTLKASQNLGYLTIMWSLDTIDWRDKDVNLIYKRATKNVKGGDLILAHPTEKTMNALVSILEYYKNNNIIATTVSDCISIL